MGVDRPGLARQVLGDHPHGQAAVAEGTASALAKVTDPVAMLLVEGVSDQIAVEALAARRRDDLADAGVAVVPTGGAGGIGRVLEAHTTAKMRLVALCDAGEAAVVERAIARSRREVSLFVCDPDLEAELLRAVGAAATLGVLARQGDLGSFTTLQRQVHWRGRPTESQLRRFIAAGARRKLRYARLLIDAAVDVDRVPRPLMAALDAALR